MAFDYKRWKEQQYSAANDTPVPTNGCPTVIFLVGTIWSAVGSLQALTPLLYLLKSGRNDLCGLIPWGLMHLYCGVRTLSGTAPGTVRYGIVSVFFGLLWVGVAGAGAESALTNPNAHPNAPLMVLGLGAAGVALLLAGSLAMLYSANYQRWHDPYGSSARTSAPVPKQRVDRPTSPKKETAPKFPVPGWAWLCVGAGVLVFGLLGGAGLVLKPSAPPGTSEPSATIVEYGRYGPKGRIPTEPSRNAAGVVTVSSGGLLLLEQTDQIPCRVGEVWGIRIRFADVPTNRPYTIRRETHHPPMTHPDGSVRTKSVQETKVPQGAVPVVERIYSWWFLAGGEHELVAGEWSIVLFIDDVEVARKSFHIRK
jgi:hypothetical protein